MAQIQGDVVLKIKVFILTKDSNYAQKFSQMVTLSFSDKITVLFFSDVNKFQVEIEKLYPDIVVLGEEFIDSEITIPDSSSVVYFVEKNNIDTIDGKKTICKYQMISQICHELMDLYAEKEAQAAITLKGPANGKKILTFTSPAGGVGTSSVAAGCARRLATQGQKALYLNLELFDAADRFFSGEGNYNLSRVIYALEMANSATAAKLESSLRRDAGGVYFYSRCTSALDLLSLDQEALEQLYEELATISIFNWIVADVDCALDERLYRQIERSYATILVSDGSASANCKLRNCLDALEIIAQQRQTLPADRIFVMYNRFSSTNGQKAEVGRFKEAGGINRFENATDPELVKLIANNKVFDEFIL